MPSCDWLMRGGCGRPTFYRPPFPGWRRSKDADHGKGVLRTDRTNRCSAPGAPARFFERCRRDELEVTLSHASYILHWRRNDGRKVNFGTLFPNGDLNTNYIWRHCARNSSLIPADRRGLSGSVGPRLCSSGATTPARTWQILYVARAVRHAHGHGDSNVCTKARELVVRFGANRLKRPNDGRKFNGLTRRSDTGQGSGSSSFTPDRANPRVAGSDCSSGEELGRTASPGRQLYSWAWRLGPQGPTVRRRRGA